MAEGRRFIWIFVLLICFKSYLGFQEPQLDTYIKVQRSADELLKEFVAGLDESIHLSNFDQTKSRTARSSLPEPLPEHPSNTFLNEYYYNNAFTPKIPNQQNFSLDVSLADENLIKYMDKHYKLWKSFTFQRNSYLVALANRMIYIHVFNDSPGFYKMYRIEASDEKKFADVAMTPVTQGGSSRVCFVVLLNQNSNSWLQLHCLGQNGKPSLEDTKDEENILKITSTKESSPSYFSALASGAERSKIRIYSVRSSGSKVFMVLQDSINVAYVTDQDMVEIQGNIFLALSSNILQHSVYIFQKDFSGSFRSIQRLDTSQTNDVTYFTIGYRHFLAVTSNGNYQSIYEFKNGLFRLIQKIYVAQGLKWNAMKIPNVNEQFALLLVYRDALGCHQIQTYFWNSWQEVFELDFNQGCTKTSVYHRVGHAKSLSQISSSTYSNFDEAKLHCDEMGARCSAIEQRSGSYHLIENGQDVADGSDTIYFKMLKKGFQCYYDSLHFPKADGVTTFVKERYLYILVTDNQQHARIFKANIYTFPLYGVSDKEKQSLTKWERKVEDLIESMKNVSTAVEGILSKDGDQDLNYTLVVNGDLIIKDNFSAKKICLSNGSIITTDVESIKNLIAEIEMKLQRIEDKLNNALITGNHINLKGQNIFSCLVVKGSVTATSASIKKIKNEIDLKSVLPQIVRTDEPAVLKGTVTITGKVTVKNGDVVVETINEIPFSSFMTLVTQQQTSGTIRFSGPVRASKDISIDGPINGLILHRDAVFKDLNCRILSQVTFLGNVIVESDVTMTSINDVKLIELTKDILTVDGDQHIKGQVVLTDDVIVRNSLSVDWINGVKMKSFLSSVLKTNEPGIITGHYTFVGNVKVTGKVNVEDSINGIKVDDFVFKNTDAEITGTKTFLGHLHVDHLSVPGKINGLKISDVLTKSTEQIINGHLTFKRGFESTSSSNCEVGGFVGGVNLTHALELYMSLKSHVDDMEDSDEVVINEKIELGSSIGGYLWSDLMTDVVFIDDAPDVYISGKKTFEHPIIVHDTLNMQYVNGMDLHTDFLRRSGGEQTITGTKVFASETLIRNLNINGAFNGIDVEKLNREIVRLDRPQDVSGEKIFVDKVNFKRDISCEGGINGLSFPSDVVLKGQTQTIFADKHFGDLAASSLTSYGSLWVSGTVHGTNISHFMNNRLTLTTDQTLDTSFNFKSIIASGHLGVNTVNSKSFKRFARTLLMTDQQQTVYAAHRFSGNVLVKGNVITANGINGFDLKHLFSRSFRIDQNNKLPDDIRLAKYLTVDGDIKLNGRLNEVDLNYFAQNLLHQGREDAEINAALVLNGNLDIMGDLNVIGSINDLQIKTIFSRNTPQNITGKFTFQNDIWILGEAKINNQLTVKDKSIDLQELYSSTWKSNEPAELTGSISFLDPITIKAFNPARTINGHDIVKISQNAAYADQPCRITGQKIFKRIVKVASLNCNLVNGVDLSRFLKNVVYVDETSVLNGTIFQGHVKFLGSFTSQGNLKVGGLVGGHNLQQMFQNALYIDRNAVITGRVRFSSNVGILGNVEMTGRLNSLDISNDVVFLSSDQTITGKKEFQGVHCTSSVEIGTTVNGYHLQTLRQSTLMNHGDQTLVIASSSGTLASSSISSSSGSAGSSFSDSSSSSSGGGGTDDASSSGTAGSSSSGTAGSSSSGTAGSSSSGTAGSSSSGTAGSSSSGTAGSSSSGTAGSSSSGTAGSSSSGTAGSSSSGTVGSNFSGSSSSGSAISSGTSGSSSSSGSSTFTGQESGGTCEIAGSFFVTGDLAVSGKVNGLILSEDILNQDSEQTVTQSLAFTNMVSLSDSVTMTGALGESITMEDLYNKAVELESSSSMTGFFNFENSVTFEGELNITGRLNISHMPKFENNLQILRTNIEPALFGASISARNSCLTLTDFYDTMKNSFVYKYQGFVKVNELQVEDAKNHMLVKVADQYFVFEASISNDCKEPVVYYWNKDHTFVKYGTLIYGLTRNWANFKIDDNYYVVNAEESLTCQSEGSIIYKYDPITKSFLKHMKTDIFASDVRVIEYQDKDYVQIAFAVYKAGGIIITFDAKKNLITSRTTFPFTGVSHALEAFYISSLPFVGLSTYNEITSKSTTIFYRLEDQNLIKSVEIPLLGKRIVHFQDNYAHYILISNLNPKCRFSLFAHNNDGDLSSSPIQDIRVQFCLEYGVFEIGYSKDIYLAIVILEEVKIYEFQGASGFKLYETIKSRNVRSVSFLNIRTHLYMVISNIFQPADVYVAEMEGSTVPPEEFNCG